MNKDLLQGILIGKMCASTERAAAAERRGQIFKARKLYRLALVAARRYSYSVSEEAKAVRCKLAETRHAVRKAEKAGITTPLAEPMIKHLEHEAEEADKLVVAIGESIVNLLDGWQRVGGTLVSLCDLCGIPYERALTQIKPERRGERLSGILYILEVDDRYPDRWCHGYPYDAPLSFAVQEFFLNFMTRTPEGRAAAHDALEKFFPEIVENALTMYTDADGNKHLIDKDGVEVGEVLPGE